MRCLIVALIAVAWSFPACAAVKQPVQWRVKSAPARPLKAGTKFNVTIAGDLDAGWHLYALEEPDGGPVATEVALSEGDTAELVRVEEGKPEVLLDPLFQKPTGFFEHLAEFTLHLKAAKDAVSGPHAIHVLVRYQSCNDRVCLPPHTDTVTVPIVWAQ